VWITGEAIVALGPHPESFQFCLTAKGRFSFIVEWANAHARFRLLLAV
jgi:hypothetical protein